MNETQAEEVVTLLRAATASRVEQGTIEYFKVALLPLDYNLALSAAAIGTITWRRFPPWADFKEIYRAQVRIAGPVGEQRSDISTEETDEPIPKRGVAAPEWVWVWQWARIERQPPETRWFPQQVEVADPNNTMSNDDYEKVRSEWKQAGSPKGKSPIPMAR